MLFFSPTASAQVTVERRPGQRPAPGPSPVVTVNEKAFEQMPEAAFREILVKRLNALEAENKELKSQLSATKLSLEAENKELKSQFLAMKLLLTGLDKAFATHTHRIQAAYGTAEQIRIMNDQRPEGEKPRIVFVTFDGLKSVGGFSTSTPNHE
jgi:hypothetical protein